MDKKFNSTKQAKINSYQLSGLCTNRCPTVYKINYP